MHSTCFLFLQLAKLLDLPTPAQDTMEIVNFVGNYKNTDGTPAVYIMLNLYYDDPSIDHANGNLPTCAAAAVWTAIAKAFASAPHVIFSITNEPFYPSSAAVGDSFSGTDLQWSANVWQAMNTFVAIIRAAEADAGTANQHLIAVQASHLRLLYKQQSAVVMPRHLLDSLAALTRALAP